jgi:hypothetical protein
MRISLHNPSWYHVVVLVLLCCLDQASARPTSSFRKPSKVIRQDRPGTKTTNPSPALADINNKMTIRQSVIYLVPPLTTFGAFYYFRQTAHFFHSTVHWLAHITDTWLPKTAADIDLQTQVVTQVVNGPVITSISLLFAALVSTTVSTLHTRQMELYNSFSKQIHELNHLQSLVQHLSPVQVGIVRPQVNALIECILFQESLPESVTPDWGTHIIDTLLFEVQNWILQTPASSSGETTIVLQTHDTLRTIAETHRNHFCILKKHFPIMHYCTLTLLAMCICASFLIATDQALYVLESIPVRLLWSILVGSFTSLAVVCYDLAAPFAGVYKVAMAKVKENNFPCSL